MTDCDYDYRPSVYVQRERKARTSHRCDECRCVICPGEQYEYTFGVWDGRPDSFKTCARCAAVIRYARAAPCFCFAHRAALEDARETFSEIWQDAGAGGSAGLCFGMGRLLVAVRRHRQTQRSA